MVVQMEKEVMVVIVQVVEEVQVAGLIVKVEVGGQE